MYKSLVRARIRKGIARLNAGDTALLRNAAAPDAELIFPGNNSWSRQFRDPRRSSAAFVTHRGLIEVDAYAERFVAAGLRIDVDDIVVAGPPWRTKVVVRGTDSATDGCGRVVYQNRLVLWLEARWGVIRRCEDYLDTERVRDWDDRIAAGLAPTIPDCPGGMRDKVPSRVSRRL